MEGSRTAVRKRRRFRFCVAASNYCLDILRADISKGPLRDFKTGTGFARAKLSEVRSSRRQDDKELALLASSG